MLEQQIIIAVAVWYLAFCVASLLKFGIQKQVTVLSVLVSAISPFLFFVFIVTLHRQVSQKIRWLHNGELRFFRLLKCELYLTPMLHTGMIKILCAVMSESPREQAEKKTSEYVQEFSSEITPILGAIA